ncbi:hypothetical protein OPQ81_007500 [Rhizoctonia solani]|nr:hypothetical protein OPQ81_007500 [Rhizoctonia solani]
MSSKRRRYSTSSSNDGQAEPSVEDHALIVNPDQKLPRTFESTVTRSLVCSLPPTCAHPRHPTTLGSLRELEEHYKKYHTHICQEGDCRNEPGGAKIFPDARMLELHQKEYHDELAMIKNERGESIFACFLESCPKKFRTPKGRRLHLIDVHGYPKLFFFAVTKHGVGGLLARYGEGATLIRKPWKPRPGNASGAKDDDDSEEDLKSGSRPKDTTDQFAPSPEAQASVTRSSSATVPHPHEDLDELASSMKKPDSYDEVSREGQQVVSPSHTTRRSMIRKIRSDWFGGVVQNFKLAKASCRRGIDQVLFLTLYRKGFLFGCEMTKLAQVIPLPLDNPQPTPSLICFFDLELSPMPHPASIRTKRFKKWLLRFKTGKSVKSHSTGVEVLPAQGNSQPVPAPRPAQASGATFVSAKEDTVISPSTTSAVVIGTHKAKDSQRSSTSINDLPRELFVRILLHDEETDNGPNLPLLASWTCSRWREVVLNTPTLWSTVCLGIYGAGLPEILLRSGGCGIDFILDSVSAESITFPRDVSGLLAILEPHYYRIRSLNLVLPDQDCVETALARLCGAVPNLRSLELSLPYDPYSGMQVFAPALAPDIASSFGVVGCGSGEKLRVLKLQAVNFPWYDDAFSHLTTLRLASMCTEETMIVWEQLAETLMRNSSTLEELSLDQCDFCIEDESLSFPVITLPRLKYLHLRLVDPALIATLLSYTSMPALETLELEFDPDDQCEVFRALFPSTSTCPDKEPVKSLGKVRSLAIQGGAYQADLFCEIIGRMPDLERLMLGGCIVTAAIIRTLSVPRVARKLTDMWLELCENYCAFDLQRLARARCGGVRIHEIGSAGQAPIVM